MSSINFALKKDLKSMGIIRIDDFFKPNSTPLINAIKEKWHIDRLRDDPDYRDAWNSLSDVLPKPDYSNKIIRNLRLRNGQVLYYYDEMTDEEMLKYGLKKVTTTQELMRPINIVEEMKNDNSY